MISLSIGDGLGFESRCSFLCSTQNLTNSGHTNSVQTEGQSILPVGRMQKIVGRFSQELVFVLRNEVGVCWEKRQSMLEKVRLKCPDV